MIHTGTTYLFETGLLKVQEFLYPEYDLDLSKNLINCSLGESLPAYKI